MSDKKLVTTYAARNRLLIKLGFADYAAYLASELWANVRQAAFTKHGGRCIKCARKAGQIHHSSYDRATLLGENLDHLHPVCRECHESAEVVGGRKSTINEANVLLGIGKLTPKPYRSRKPTRYCVCGVLLRKRTMCSKCRAKQTTNVEVPPKVEARRKCRPNKMPARPNRSTQKPAIGRGNPVKRTKKPHLQKTAIGTGGRITDEEFCRTPESEELDAGLRAVSPGFTARWYAPKSAIVIFLWGAKVGAVRKDGRLVIPGSIFQKQHDLSLPEFIRRLVASAGWDLHKPTILRKVIS